MAAKISTELDSFGQKFLKIKNFVLLIADIVAQITSLIERLHKKSIEGRCMDRRRRTARKTRELHVTDNKANKVSRGRTTKFVTSRKVCCACSGMPAIRHRWFCSLPEDAVWLKGDAPSCDKTMKTGSGGLVQTHLFATPSEFNNSREAISRQLPRITNSI